MTLQSYLDGLGFTADRGWDWEQRKGRAVLVEKSQGCKGTFWTRPSGKDVLVLKSCSTGWQHLQAVTGARNIAAADDLLILLLFASLGCLRGFCNFTETTSFYVIFISFQ